MQIFVISLSSDYERRKKLESQFLLSYNSFSIVNACNLDDVNVIEHTINIGKSRVPVNRVEVACALSHMKIYKKMASENIKYCLIFEDDVIGSDQDINKVVEIYKKLPKNSILLAGGMDGIKFKKYLYGKEIFTNVYQINPLYYQFLVRACCYVIPLDLAKKILRMQENCLIRADEWGEFLMKENNVFVSPIFHHPLDLTNSHIEKFRRKELNSVFQRLLQEGIIFTFLRVIQRGFLRILAKLKGLDSIFK
ncbi:hypothetical protein C3941_28815 [Kaistia algarum]|nr:hypothetical protein C3941_28815 [Kaistia algarum]